MKRLATTLFVVATIGMGRQVSHVQAAGKPGSSELPLVVSLNNNPGDRVRSDNGTYVSGQMNVRAVLVGNDAGNFVFDTNDNAGKDGGRRLVLDFTGQAGIPFPSNVPILIDTFWGTLSGGTAQDGNLRTLALGNSLTRRGPISWSVGTTAYALRWHGQNGAGLLKFTCVGVDALSICNEWAVSPTGKAQLDSSPTKGAATQTIWGYYDMPFQMTLTTVP